MAQTKIIAIEGIDGSGKSVQFKLLKEALLSRAYSVGTRAFPVYDSYFGKEVGRYLTGADGVLADAVDAKSMALWFALDRWDNLRDYQDGEYDYLLINRYVLSNAVYQSIRDIDQGNPDRLDWVYHLEFDVLKLPRPDIHLFFDVEETQAGANVLKKGHRDYVGSGRDVYEASFDIQKRAREKYLAYAARCDDIDVIPCMKDGALLPPESILNMTLEMLTARGII